MKSNLVKIYMLRKNLINDLFNYLIPIFWQLIKALYYQIINTMKNKPNRNQIESKIYCGKESFLKSFKIAFIQGYQLLVTFSKQNHSERVRFMLFGKGSQANFYEAKYQFAEINSSHLPKLQSFQDFILFLFANYEKCLSINLPSSGEDGNIKLFLKLNEGYVLEFTLRKIEKTLESFLDLKIEKQLLSIYLRQVQILNLQHQINKIINSPIDSNSKKPISYCSQSIQTQQGIMRSYFQYNKSLRQFSIDQQQVDRNDIFSGLKQEQRIQQNNFQHSMAKQVQPLNQMLSKFNNKKIICKNNLNTDQKQQNIQTKQKQATLSTDLIAKEKDEQKQSSDFNYLLPDFAQSEQFSKFQCYWERQSLFVTKKVEDNFFYHVYHKNAISSDVAYIRVILRKIEKHDFTIGILGAKGIKCSRKDWPMDMVSYIGCTHHIMNGLNYKKVRIVFQPGDEILVLVNRLDRKITFFRNRKTILTEPIPRSMVNECYFFFETATAGNTVSFPQFGLS